MPYLRSRTFNRDLRNLAEHLQAAAGEKFRLFQDNPIHPSLRIKKMKGQPGIWEGHVTESCVFTFEKDADPETGEITYIFRRIGTHDIYRNP